ncbi:hypothetical protein QGN23_03825 [Chryseobacterium gotjawalense]|uniref:Lipoprotein n=1 Tax=Chryseobacterium gotjawalense TaxID=3042315 RepID=A0ABY8REM8_9FLAO|nr:hypothetical protein [Chryseobacterium sp. wdc7]WHF52415.1 hypothetical protein QGN23_03825 [Chryseobacterium sp. wdc7]
MKYLILIIFCVSCTQNPDYQMMVNKSINFVKYNERLTTIQILREKKNQNIKNGKYHKFLSEKELLSNNKTFCDLVVQDGKKKGTVVVIMSFCSGVNYAYYFSGKDNLDSMVVIQTKKMYLDKADSICMKIMKLNHPEILDEKKGMIPPLINVEK